MDIDDLPSMLQALHSIPSTMGQGAIAIKGRAHCVQGINPSMLIPRRKTWQVGWTIWEKNLCAQI